MVELQADSVENATYTWFLNGTNLGINGQTITANHLGNYQVFVQKGVCSFMSEKVFVKLNQNPIAKLQQLNGINFCQNGELNASLGSSFEITPTENGSYSAKITNQNGCIIQTRTVYFSIPELPVITGEEDLKTDLFKIYPNPSKGIFKVQFPVVLTENVEISIFDTTGKIIKTQFFEKNNQEFVIDIQNVAKGMYLIRFNQNNTVYSKSIILE
ncbi:hypothetical protein Fleli_2455 [Bernardetia litoralis DSM 6794]|uniref:Secretion system C-terminal sorting domain-containing protein n=1 Tax=Bernardetia litoralis (strain ATCC 23117 / DSM 6794 / NBRC 15988 / NCIMB 1366 / Fx l1 / Sio-4) TaxID=880071 RepID=I4ALI6_BERLS|nr:T9SS type A sorting domain-containing protein [Bernardetia litoralis]AFM04821.1 hypothetical protein Fleli_2455 [Bernardetia litoralis DSM 6794]